MKTLYQDKMVMEHYCSDLMVVYVWGCWVFLVVGNKITCKWIRIKSFICSLAESQHCICLLPSKKKKKKIRGVTLILYTVCLIP